MLATTPAFLHWLAVGAKESLAMLWMTWWPLVLGFTLAGVVQSVVPRGGLRARLGATTPRSVATASLLGVVSSSCSYAASATSRAMFARGASWSNSLIFMVASTNLVVELGVVLYLLLGWQFLLAQLIGGAVMVVLLALTTRVLFNAAREARLATRVHLDAPPPLQSGGSLRQRLRDRESLATAARYTLGDLKMVRKELVAGFVIAGFLSVHVPATWWRHLFWSGHGAWTVLENVLVAPLLAVVTFVCSVGNIPLAATLWGHGVAFGGVVAFIFADLVTLPLLFIYRRYYGAGSAGRLFLQLWFVISASGLLVNGLFHVTALVPSRHLRVLDGQFPLGATLVLNVLAAAVLAVAWWLSRATPSRVRVATDPVCGMSVDVTAPAATAQRDGVTYYFCSPRCRDRFERRGDARDGVESTRAAIDPVCQMPVEVRPSAPSAEGADGLTYYFCCEGCRRTFLAGPRLPTSQPVA